MDGYNAVSLLGIVLLPGIAWVFSADRRKMNWRVIGWGIGIQLAFALFLFRAPVAAKLFLFVNGAAVKVLGCAGKGTEFLFGPLATGSSGFILAIQGLATIPFFSALVAVLYFTGVLPLMIRAFAAVFTWLMRVSGAESLCAASNIFVGIESALTVKPHLSEMTRSELCTVLAVGMATVASNVLLMYVSMLKALFPNIAGHLISASLLSAPAALVMSKILLPETGAPKTLGTRVRPHYERESSLFEAIINGANAGLRLVGGICALLLAVLGLVALVNLLLGAVGGWVNSWTGWTVDWTLEGLLGCLFWPFAVIMGVPPADVGVVAKILGTRAVVTEIAGYQQLAGALEAGRLMHPRSQVIAAYALCGFAHIASMSIFVGGVAALVPERTRDLVAVGFRALVAATLACLLTGAVAGTFYTAGSGL